MSWFGNDKSVAELRGGQLARQAAASLAGLLAERGLTRGQLAAQMGVSPGRVSQILSGDANLTMRSLALAAAALDANVEITFSSPAQATPPPAHPTGDVTEASPLQRAVSPIQH